MTNIKKLLLLIVCIFYIIGLKAQAFKVDDPVGTVNVYQHISKKGKGLTKSEMELTAKEDTPDGTILYISIYYAPNRKSNFVKMTIEYKDDEMLFSNINNFMLSPLIIPIDEDPGFDLETDEEKIIYPNKMTVGEKLPSFDYQLGITLFGENGNLEQTAVRKVIDKETITLPAGTFDAYVIEEVTTSKAEIANETSDDEDKTHIWFVPELGIVKQVIVKNDKRARGYQLIEVRRP